MEIKIITVFWILFFVYATMILSEIIGYISGIKFSKEIKKFSAMNIKKSDVFEYDIENYNFNKLSGLKNVYHYLTEVDKAIDDGLWVDFQCKGKNPPLTTITIRHTDPVSHSSDNIGGFSRIEASNDMSIQIHSSRIRHLKILRNFTGDIFLSNCKVLNIEFEDECRAGKISIQDCEIFHLWLNTNCCDELNLANTKIQTIKCPAVSNSSPVRRGAAIIDTDFHYNSSDFRNVDLEELTNFKNQMDKFEIPSLSLELHINDERARRQNDGLFLKCCSIFYDLISRYGSRPERTLLIIITLFVFSTAVMSVYDSIVIIENNDLIKCVDVTSDEANQKTWLISLCGNDGLSAFSRSIYFNLQSIINPLGLVSKRYFIDVVSITWKIWISLFSIFNIGLFTLFFLGIRKRFRLKL